eukprot:sb/3469731/
MSVALDLTTTMVDEDELMQAVLGYLKKKNLTETETALRKEAKIQGDEDGLHMDKMKQVLTTYKSAQQQEKALAQFGSLCEFVENSLEMYRGELSLVIYPIFVLIYMELILSNQQKIAREFYDRYKGQIEEREEDLDQLATITSKEALIINTTFNQFRSNKYIVRMCKDSFNCLLSHLQCVEIGWLDRITSLGVAKLKNIAFEHYVWCSVVRKTHPIIMKLWN